MRFPIVDTIMKLIVSVVTLFVLSTNSPTAKIWFIPLSTVLGILSVFWIGDYAIGIIIDEIKNLKKKRREKHGI